MPASLPPISTTNAPICLSAICSLASYTVASGEMDQTADFTGSLRWIGSTAAGGPPACMLRRTESPLSDLCQRIVRIITALYRRTESGINAGTGRAPLGASGQAAWIHNSLSLSQNALISVTARAVNVCRTWTSGKRNRGAQRDPPGTCQGTREDHKGHQRDHFDLRPPPHSIFGQASEAVSACPHLRSGSPRRVELLHRASDRRSSRPSRGLFASIRARRRAGAASLGQQLQYCREPLTIGPCRH